MKNKLIYLLIIMISLLFFPACWDTMDINNRAYISALGIDEVEDAIIGQNNIPYQYKVTVEIIKPALLKVASWKLEPEQSASIIITAEGETIEKALDLIQTNISRRITLSHLNVLLISEKIADNMEDISTFFEKHPDVARRLRLIFIKNSSTLDVLKTNPKLESSVAEELLGMIEISQDFSLSTFKPFTKFLSQMRANNGQTLGGAANINKELLVRRGSAVFSQWNLIGWLDEEETRKASLIFPEPQETTFIGNLNEGIYTYRVDKKKTKITPQLQNGSLKFLVSIKTDGIITQEQGNQLSLSEPKNISKLENLFTQVITKEATEAIQTAQNKFKVDYFNFGMRLMDKEPDYYQSLNWQELFPTVPIKIEVQVIISRFGIAK